MKFWESSIIKSLGWKEEPKGIAKVMSICMLIVIASTIFLHTNIQEIKFKSTLNLFDATCRTLVHNGNIVMCKFFTNIFKNSVPTNE